MSNPLRRLLEQQDVVIADGAMGTNLFALGLGKGDNGAAWNVERPDAVKSVHQGFVDAGSDILLTNTFGANRIRLSLHHLEHRAREFNFAGARLAREVADDEFDAAARAVHRAGLDYVATMTFDSAGRTMMGVRPEDAMRRSRGFEWKPVAFGANCGVGPSQLMDSVIGLVQGAAKQAIVVAKSNCGIPVLDERDRTRTLRQERLLAELAIGIDQANDRQMVDALEVFRRLRNKTSEPV
jgi:5-methyltetrahydrofolate--homocysteine methyltransferase